MNADIGTKYLFQQACLFFLLLLFLAAQFAIADIYKKVDRYGDVHFTDRPRGEGYRLLRKAPVKRSTEYTRYKLNRQRYEPIIRRRASRLGIDPALVLAVVHTESYYDKNAISKAGAVGLMQLMPETAEHYGVNDRKNALENIDGGMKYLKHLLNKYEFNLKLAVAAYNAGETAIAKYGNKIPPYPETQAYVKRVLAHYQTYLNPSSS
ncbi:MAG: lytic transglycosylase [Cycloclasticus sp. symbiont of Poecilosclerida sp. M]|nr:MAG: lytic transglycosylase [Cycloclasticus sp. symbiont of Poecilosclerida sp. M]